MLCSWQKSKKHGIVTLPQTKKLMNISSQYSVYNMCVLDNEREREREGGKKESIYMFVNTRGKGFVERVKMSW